MSMLTMSSARIFGNMDPNAAMISMNEELVEISVPPIADSVFRTPEWYSAVPLAEILSARRPLPMIGVLPASPTPTYGMAPSVIQQSVPVYTEEARRNKIEGAVTLSVVVGTDGKARDIQVVQSLDPSLDQKAVESVGQ